MDIEAGVSAEFPAPPNTSRYMRSMDIEAGASAEFPAAPNNFRLLPGGNSVTRRPPNVMPTEHPIRPVSVLQSDVGKDDYDQHLEMGSKVGIWATGFVTTGLMAVFTAPGLKATSLVEKLLAKMAILAMLISYISGGALLILPIFRPDPPLPISKIKVIIALAIASMASVVCIGLLVKLFQI